MVRDTEGDFPEKDGAPGEGEEPFKEWWISGLGVGVL